MKNINKVIGSVIALCLFGCGGGGDFSNAPETLPNEEKTATAVPMETGGSSDVGTGGMPSTLTGNGGSVSPSNNGGNTMSDQDAGNMMGTGGSAAMGTGGVPSTSSAGGVASSTGGSSPSDNGGMVNGTGGMVATSGPHCPSAQEEYSNVHCQPGTYTVDCVGFQATFELDLHWGQYLNQIPVPQGFTLQSAYDGTTGFHYTSYCQGPLTFTLPVTVAPYTSP
jgi:hypothetical protein